LAAERQPRQRAYEPHDKRQVTRIPATRAAAVTSARKAIKSGIITSGTTRCEAIGEFARLAVDHLEWLRRNGHPKWQSVTLDPARILAMPRLSPCVARRLGR
jgi:hypothetical protein